MLELDWRHRLLGVVLAVQLLLVPAYRSTDFEVHRNWMAITYTLPISKWYTEATSEWTLDYPPFFACFERCLALIARLFDPKMLAVSNLDYDSPATVLFQRLSVSATGLVLAAAMFRATRAGKDRLPELLLFGLVVANAGLLLVDNIHFQYNGLLLGILMWSVLMVEEGRDIAAAALFAVLLNMKHLFLYAAPVYFVYLLRHFCMAAGPGAATTSASFAQQKGHSHSRTTTPRKASNGDSASSSRSSRAHGPSGLDLRNAAGRLFVLGGVTAAIFGLSFGPFVARGQLRQLLGRLFPFGRGLCHSYWAANAWALYAFVDKVAAAVLSRVGLIHAPAANMAGGIVGVARFAVLPQIGPSITAAATLLALSPCLASLWRNPRPQQFAAAVAYAALCGFVWGYHVHEKAALTVIIPMALSAVRDAGMGQQFLVLSTAAHVGLMPLLFALAEAPIKWLVVLLYTAAAWAGLAAVHGGGASICGSSAGVVTRRKAAELEAGRWQLPLAHKVFLWGFVPLEMYCALLHEPLLGGRLPFLPLMLTSVYCAIGVVGVWSSMFAAYVVELQGAGLRQQDHNEQQLPSTPGKIAAAKGSTAASTHVKAM